MTTISGASPSSYGDGRSYGLAQGDTQAPTSMDEGSVGVLRLVAGNGVELRVDDHVELALQHVPTAYERWCKPVLDRLLAAVALVVVSPVLLVAWLLVRWQLGSPVLFHQDRLGRHERVFSMLKFRTMMPDRRMRSRGYRGPDRRMTHKSKDDPRHTPVGRFLRSTSIDELPQLLNVLRGDMSLVGPRPELVSVASRHYEDWHHARHAVKPGITGLWQVTERGNGLMHEHIAVDLEYVRRVSFWTDLRILLMTPISLVKQGRSAAW